MAAGVLTGLAVGRDLPGWQHGQPRFRPPDVPNPRPEERTHHATARIHGRCPSPPAPASSKAKRKLDELILEALREQAKERGKNPTKV